MATDEQRPIELVPHEDETPTTPRTKRAIADVGLPALLGTDEQVAEAREIRSSLLMDADDVMTDLRTDRALTFEQRDTAVHPHEQVSGWQVYLAEQALNRLRHEQSAAWWIQHSGADARGLLNEFIAEVKAERLRSGPEA